MKKFLTLILSSILLLSACNRASTEEQTSSISKETPYLTGTFVQLFGKNDWTTAQWEMFFSELKELKINTVIVQYTAFKNAYNDITWFDSANTFTSQKSRHTLTRLFE